MRQTLFFVPHEIAGVPVFGFGWLLAFVVLAGIVTFVFHARSKGTSEAIGFLPFLGLLMVIVGFVLPFVEVPIAEQERGFMLWDYTAKEGASLLGLPIRGYGVFLLIATVSGVLLACHRARQVGLSPDAILNLAFYMFVGGILGARVFYIIQYWSEIHDPESLRQTLANMVNFVQGGLVVYGSLVGALIAGVIFLKRNQLPLLPVADLIAPSLVVGLAIGRIGCLMNGCCYGGVCEHPWAIQFPSSAPAYYDQHSAGLLYGFRIPSDDDTKPTIVEVIPNSKAAESGIQPGEALRMINGTPVKKVSEARELLASARGDVEVETGKSSYAWTIGSLPEKSLPVHPTQLYSTINASLLAVLTYFAFPYRKRDGQIFAVLIIGYAITRFLLEVIRTDEGSFAGTGMTISQNVSVAMIIGAIALLAYIWRQSEGSFWPSPVAS